MVIDGLNSRVDIPGVLDLGLTSIENPVTGEPEQLTLVKGTGTSSWSIPTTSWIRTGIYILAWPVL